MRQFFVVLVFVWFTFPQFVFSYNVIQHVVSKPYDVLNIDNIDDEQFVIGELTDNPDMIEIVSDRDFILRAEIRALPGESLPQLNGIIVKVIEPRGVEEVARLYPNEATWEEKIDPVSRLPYLLGPSFSTVTSAGTYRVEVSTADNLGKYILVVGNNQTNSGYNATWKSVTELYKFYNQSRFGMIFTPLVYYPLGILLLCLGFGYTVYLTRQKLPFWNKHA